MGEVTVLFLQGIGVVPKQNLFDTIEEAIESARRIFEMQMEALRKIYSQEGNQNASLQTDSKEVRREEETSNQE